MLKKEWKTLEVVSLLFPLGLKYSDNLMSLQINQHFVAFIDILGFAEMVSKDCESSSDPKYLKILYNAHTHATKLLSNDLHSGLMQFSDSIVFSSPFDFRKLQDFLYSVAELQKFLLINGLLCRGGIAFGKHFAKDKFLFSKAMIDAYNLEHSRARYPRIIVSENLLSLASTQLDVSKLALCREDDGEHFVNYLSPNSEEEKSLLLSQIQQYISNTKKSPSSVQEKVRWLARYADHILSSNFSNPQFAAI